MLNGAVLEAERSISRSTSSAGKSICTTVKISPKPDQKQPAGGKILELNPIRRKMHCSGFLPRRDVAQPGRALAWGARGRQFKSARPDQLSWGPSQTTLGISPAVSPPSLIAQGHVRKTAQLGVRGVGSSSRPVATNCLGGPSQTTLGISPAVSPLRYRSGSRPQDGSTWGARGGSSNLPVPTNCL